MADYLNLDATELARLIRERELSPVEVAEASLERCMTDNDRLNAYCFFDRDTTLRHAQEAEERIRRGAPASALDGVPYAVKDTLHLAGWPTRKGSHTTPTTAVDITSPMIAALNDAGCVPVGKTTTPEFGWKGVTDSPLTGFTRNPHDASRCTGGSSGGSGASVAAFGVPLATGTDSGGSIRMPAAFCGIVGFKPTYGAIPWWPATPLGRVTHAGPMTRSVRDAWEMFRISARVDHRDTVLAARTLPTDLEETGVAGLRIAFSAECEHMDPDVRRNFERTLHDLEAAGAILEEAWPFPADTLEVFETVYHAGLAAVVDGVDPGLRHLLEAELREVAGQGTGVRIEDYLAAQVRVSQMREATEQFHKHHDLLLTPTLPITAFEAGREVPADWPHARWTTWSPFTWPFNLTGQPACALPNGRSREGLPTSVQLVAPRHEDARLMQAAAAVEAVILEANRQRVAGVVEVRE